MYSNLSPLLSPTKDEEKWTAAAKKAVEKAPEKKKTSKLQDALSVVKSALTSDTGKGILKGLAATTAAAAIGGSSGVQALGGIMGKIEQNKKDRDLENVRKTREKLSGDTAQLNLEYANERLQGQKLRNYKELQDGIVGSMATGGIGNIGRVKAGVSGKPQTGPSSPKEETLKIPDTVPQALTSGTFGDPEKSIEKAQVTGATLGSDAAIMAGLKGRGFKALKENRGDISKMIGNLGLNPIQANAAQRGMSEEVAPGEYNRQKAIVDSGGKVPGNETWQAQLANYGPRAFMGAAGGMIGSAFGPLGTVAGATIATAIANPLVDRMSKYIQDSTAPLDPQLMSWGDQMALGLQKAGVYDRMSAADLIPDLMRQPEISSMPEQQREQLIQYLLNKFPDSYSRPDAGY